ncbi:asparagine synthase (glutamine-hydrolyzing) [Nitrospinae bacterium]|nr:asparagine synthase (glutamine-hydrolyzing) [Nitrospinota bacterium]
MCGFVGLFNKQKVPDTDLKEAADSIMHRGPDMQGTETGYNWKVAFNRLSINDLSSKGMQPFRYQGVVVYVNGEIYNYIELGEEHKGEFKSASGSDVEIIPFLYKKYGLKFLDLLNGMFSIILIDETKKINYLIRDRFGKKPLYYCQGDENLFFASEVKALKNIKNLEVDKINLKINFSCWFLPQPLTLYKDTYNVYPGSYLKYENGEITENRWYNPKIKTTSENEDVISENFINFFRKAIKYRLRSDVPVGVFLSGGLDSTSIAKFSKEFSTNRFYAFGAKIPGKEDWENSNTDTVIPQKLCKDLGIKYEAILLDYDYFNKNIIKIVANYDEILMNSGVLIFYALSALAKKNGVSVIMAGIGGDEIFGGYPWQSGVTRKLGILFKGLHNKVPYSNYLHKMLDIFWEKLPIIYQILSDHGVWHSQTLGGSMFFNPRSKEKCSIDEKLRTLTKNYYNFAENNFYDGDIYNKMHYRNIFTVMGHQNYQSDIGCMSQSVENRSPFEDVDLFEYMMSVPDKVKIRDGHKGLLRKVLKKHMPSYVTEAKKSGPTMPIHTWFYDENMYEPIKKFVLKNIKLIQSFLSPEIAKNISGQYDKYFAEKNSLRLFAVINFLIWIKVNITHDIKSTELSFEELIRK